MCDASPSLSLSRVFVHLTFSFTFVLKRAIDRSKLTSGCVCFVLYVFLNAQNHIEFAYHLIDEKRDACKRANHHLDLYSFVGIHGKP